VNQLVVLPLEALGVGILLQVILSRVLSPKWKGWLAFLAGVTALIAILALLPTIIQGSTVDRTLFSWDQNISLQYHVDGLSLIFALMATGIGSAILLYCIQYIAHEPEGITRFYVLMLTFIAGLVNLVFSANLLLVYLSWEVIGLCSYFLVGFWYKETVGRQRRAKSAGHDPHPRLWIARRHLAALPSERHFRLDRSFHQRGFHYRHFRTYAGRLQWLNQSCSRCIPGSPRP